RPISSLRSAKNPQGNTMKRVKGVEDLNICIIGAQGIVGVGAITRTCTASCLVLAAVRRALARWGKLDRVPARVLPARARPLYPVSGRVSGEVCRGPQHGPLQFFSDLAHFLEKSAFSTYPAPPWHLVCMQPLAEP